MKLIVPMLTSKHIKTSEKGATAVEFAVIAAILFVILFGILEFSVLFLQEHFVANAAREGVRIGVRANNYNCFSDAESTECPPKSSRVNREDVVDLEVRNYLDSFYDTSPPGIVGVTYSSVSTDKKTLTVEVTVPNFYPPILSSLIRLIPGGGFTLPTEISFTATGDYEDPSEP